MVPAATVSLKRQSLLEIGRSSSRTVCLAVMYRPSWSGQIGPVSNTILLHTFL